VGEVIECNLMVGEGDKVKRRMNSIRNGRESGCVVAGE